MPGTKDLVKRLNDEWVNKTQDDMKVNSVEQVIDNGVRRCKMNCTCNVCGYTKSIFSDRFLKHVGTFHKTCGRGDKNKYNHLIGTVVDDCTIMDVFGKRIKNNGPYWYALCKCNVCGLRKEIYLPEVLDKDKHPCSHNRCSYGKYPARFSKIYYNLKAKYQLPWNSVTDFGNDLFKSYTDKANEIGEENVTISRLDPIEGFDSDNVVWTDIRQINPKSSSILFKATSPNGKEYVGLGLGRFCKYHNIDEQSMRKALYTKSGRCKNGWKICRISESEYRELTNSPFIREDIPFIVMIIRDTYDEWKLDPKRVNDDGSIDIPRMVIESKMCGYMFQDVIDDIKCDPLSGLSIHYKSKKRVFNVKSKTP